LNRLVDDPRLALHGRREHGSAERLQQHQARGKPERFHGVWPRMDVAVEVRSGETDHKRVGLLYLMSITGAFFVGGFFALGVRLELLTPAGDLLRAETYNKFFSMHGIIMVFFFLVPSIPAVLGNFLLPMMIGARDVAFPRLNLLSWYVYMLGAGIITYTVASGGVDTGWTFYTPFSTLYSTSHVVSAGIAIFVVGFSSILTGMNFIVTRPCPSSCLSMSSW